MIKAVMKGPLGNLTGVILGLSAENWHRLRAGKPILVRLRELHPDLPDLAVTLIGGDTEADLMEDLRVLGPITPLPGDHQDGGDHDA